MLCSIHHFISKSRSDNHNTNATEFKQLKGFSPKMTRIELIEIEYSEYMSQTAKCSLLIQCSKSDSPMVLAIVFEKHLYNNIVSLISYSSSQQYPHIETAILRFCILQGQYGSVSMVKYLLTQHNDQVLIYCLELTDYNTSTLLIEEMKSGNTEIIRPVLKHCKKNEHVPLHV